MTTSNRPRILIAALAIALPMASVHAAALTYHGNLQDGGKPAEGNYDIALTLYSAQSGGQVIAGPTTLYSVPVHNGSFSTQVDFGTKADNAGSGWVGVQIRPSGNGDFVAMDARTATSPNAPEATCDGNWAIGGNAGNPSGSYLGNADNQPLVFKVNGVQLGELSSSASANAPDAPNVVFGSPSNLATGAGGTVAGGGRPVAYCGTSGAASCRNSVGTYGAVGGGRGNDALGYAATIPGGGDNIALGNYSFAAGAEAYAFGKGSFVWSDASSSTQFGVPNAPYTNDNVFLARATGGFYLVSGQNGSTDVGVKLAPGSGSWAPLSDRNVKTAIAGIDTGRVLDGVLAMPVTTWQYITQKADIRHMGPMAQDFYAAFHLGEDERHIPEVDEGGVALAAIQGLNKKLEAENASLHGELAALSARVDALTSATHAASAMIPSSARADTLLADKEH